MKKITIQEALLEMAYVVSLMSDQADDLFNYIKPGLLVVSGLEGESGRLKKVLCCNGCPRDVEIKATLTAAVVFLGLDGAPDAWSDKRISYFKRSEDNFNTLSQLMASMPEPYLDPRAYVPHTDSGFDDRVREVYALATGPLTTHGSDFLALVDQGKLADLILKTIQESPNLNLVLNNLTYAVVSNKEEPSNDLVAALLDSVAETFRDQRDQKVKESIAKIIDDKLREFENE